MVSCSRSAGNGEVSAVGGPNGREVDRLLGRMKACWLQALGRGCQVGQEVVMEAWC